jgi:hypothetical protein
MTFADHQRRRLAMSAAAAAPERELLFQALWLGFRTFGLQDAVQPVVARAGDHLFITVPFKAVC